MAIRKEDKVHVHNKGGRWTAYLCGHSQGTGSTVAQALRRFLFNNNMFYDKCGNLKRLS